MGNISYTYINDLYDFTLTVIFTENIVKTLKALYKTWHIKEKALDCAACTVSCITSKHITDITKYALIYRYDTLTENTISHEVNHLTAFILSDREIDLPGKEDNYENMSWLNGLLNDIVRQIIKKEKLNILDSNILSTYIKN